jgi:hypothetical protein
MPVSAPGMAGKESFEGQIASFEYTVFLKRFYAILGACGGIPAFVTQQGRNKPLVDSDEEDKRVTEDFHTAVSLITSFSSFFKITEIFSCRVLKGAIFLSV